MVESVPFNTPHVPHGTHTAQSLSLDVSMKVVPHSGATVTSAKNSHFEVAIQPTNP